MSEIFSKGFKIYPVNNRTKFAVQVSDDNRTLYKAGKSTGAYKHTKNTINDAIIQTIHHVYKNVNN